MAVHAHSPRGACFAGPALKAHGLAVWVTPSDGQEINDAVMARAAELLLARALRIAPEADVHLRPAAGAATSAVGPDPREGTADGGTPGPPSAAASSWLTVDLAAGAAHLDGTRVPLSGLEFNLLRCLVENCSRTVSRQELQCCLESLDTTGAAPRSIDVYVGRMRRKLGGGRHAITTVRSGGYRFVPGPRATVRGPAEYTI
jgi:two-component system, OmpR family, response regulator